MSPQPGCPDPIEVNLLDSLSNCNVPLSSERETFQQNYIRYLVIRFYVPFTDKCSHLRSVEFFVESMLNNANNTAFVAEKCESFQFSFSGSTCGLFSKTTVNYMGIYVDASSSGNFFLRTNAESPYNRNK